VLVSLMTISPIKSEKGLEGVGGDYEDMPMSPDRTGSTSLDRGHPGSFHALCRPLSSAPKKASTAAGTPATVSGPTKPPSPAIPPSQI
jgi:hypothetical protein